MSQPETGWDTRHQKKLKVVFLAFFKLIEKADIVGICSRLIRVTV